MIILLDTHVIFWLAQCPEKISPAAKEVIQEARQTGGLAVADETLWEMAHLIWNGRVEVQDSARDFLAVVESHFTVLPINAAIAAKSVEFSSHYPKDPTDRIIGATALVHGQKLVTADKLILASGEVPCIW